MRFTEPELTLKYRDAEGKLELSRAVSELCAINVPEEEPLSVFGQLEVTDAVRLWRRLLVAFRGALGDRALRPLTEMVSWELAERDIRKLTAAVVGDEALTELFLCRSAGIERTVREMLRCLGEGGKYGALCTVVEKCARNEALALRAGSLLRFALHSISEGETLPAAEYRRLHRLVRRLPEGLAQDCAEQLLERHRPNSPLLPRRRMGACLLASAVAGARFANREAVLEMRVGDRLALSREADNMYDTNAIRLLDRQGRRVGYVPRRHNSGLAALMDDGERFFARVTRFDDLSPYYLTEVDIQVI